MLVPGWGHGRGRSRLGQGHPVESSTAEAGMPKRLMRLRLQAMTVMGQSLHTIMIRLRAAQMATTGHMLTSTLLS